MPPRPPAPPSSLAEELPAEPYLEPSQPVEPAEPLYGEDDEADDGDDYFADEDEAGSVEGEVLSSSEKVEEQEKKTIDEDPMISDAKETLEKTVGFKDLSEGSDEGADSPGDDEEEEEGLSFMDKVDELLHELHISRRSLVRGCGCIVILALVGAAGWFGWGWYTQNYGNPLAGLLGEGPATETPVQRPRVPTTGVPTSTEVGSGKATQPVVIDSTGIASTTAVGTEMVATSVFSSYVFGFRRIENAYQVDINELLDTASDRRSRLRGHLALLKKLYDEGAASLTAIDDEVSRIQADYTTLTAKQTSDEAIFFEAVKTLNGATADERLNSFIKVSQDVVALRARFKSLQEIRSYFDQALPKLARRIQDIELNQEALVAGTKVFDVPDSDLQLIIPIEGAEPPRPATPAPVTGSTSGDPLYKTVITPNASHDYITQPGGGF